MEKHVDVAIIGGGPAGLAAAVACREKGIQDVLIIERDEKLGGILQQCIHNGFGLHMFDEELTGPEYAQRYIDKVEAAGIEALTDTMVLEITPEKEVRCINPQLGLVQVFAKSIILCMGCRERTRANILIPGSRPAGVFSAGTAQRLTNIEGYMPGKTVVILGSGDIGLIMARRLKFEGADVKMVMARKNYSNGLQRNIQQCLHDWDIPLRFRHTITKIHGKYRVEGVTVNECDEKGRPIPGTEEFVACDTVLLSVGLIPENEVAIGCGVELDRVTNGPTVDALRQTNVPGVFAAGNTLHVHDLVDFVSMEAEIAAEGAKRYLTGRYPDAAAMIPTAAGDNVAYVVPHKVLPGEPTELYFRPKAVLKPAKLKIVAGGEEVYSKKYIRLAPGEMEHLKLTQAMLDKIAGRPFVVLAEAAE